jgi:hypothetical protein
MSRLLRGEFVNVPIARLIAAACIVFALGARPVPAEDAAVPGNVVVARTSGDALVIWDASPEVAELVGERASDERASTKLERDALRVAAQSLGKIEKSANTLSVRIIYTKTGAVSPVYGAATFAGVERYATLELPLKDALADRDHWKTLDAKAPLPKWIALKVTGQLPPRQ